MSETCPSKERWQEHLNASLPADQDAVLTEHLDSCASCRKTLETLAGGTDSLLDVARQAGEATDASSPALKEIVAQFQAPSEPTQAEPSGAKDESLAFLTPSEKTGYLGRLGHYEVQTIIGKGGFGIVLKAFDEKLHRIVAIKVLSPAYAAIGSARKRFIREARAAAAVSHDHVVGIYAVEEEQNPPYIVMQCVDGQSLQDKLDKKGPLSLKEILRIGLQTAEGLAAAHKQGLVHRDIKPANILLENGVERVKITDFGLARAVDDASVTQSGTVAGTPMYMSPEQAEGLALDHRSDLFSLGTVLYAMCTGHPPFRASGTHAVLKRVIDASPRPIREINNEIPDWLCDIIAKLHAKKPEDRFQTAKEVAEWLGLYLAHLQRPTMAAQPAAIPRLAEAPLGAEVPGSRKVARARAGGRRIATAAFAVVAFFMIYSGVGLLNLPAERVSPPGVQWLLIGVGLAALVTAVCLAFSSWRGRLSASAALLLIFGGALAVSEFTDGTHIFHTPIYWVDLNVDDPNVTLKIVPVVDGADPEATILAHAVSLEWRGKQKIAQPPGRYWFAAIVDGRVAYYQTVNIDKPCAVDFPWAAEVAKRKLHEEGWVDLFNGKDLDGWAALQPSCEVKDGILKGRGLIIHERNFENFHLRVEAKLPMLPTDHGDTGVFFRCKPSVRFVTTGYGADIERSDTGEWTAALYREPRLAHTLVKRSEKIAIRPDEWFVMDVIAQGKQITIKVNDAVVADVTDSTHTRGHIALHGFAGTMVEFKTVRIKELPQTFKDDKERLQGQWVAVDLEEGGRNQKEGLNVVQWLFTFTGDRCQLKSVTRAGRTSLDEEGLFLTDLGTNPKRFRLVMPRGEKQVRQLIGIYEFQGEYLRVCYAGHAGVPVNPDYPTAFATKAGSPLQLMTLKRAPAAEPGWVQLFNGKDLTAWVEVYDKKKYATTPWDIAAPVLVLKGGKDQPTGYLRTEKQYREFHLRFDYKDTKFTFTQTVNNSHVYWGMQGPDDPSTVGWTGSQVQLEPKRANVTGLELYHSTTDQPRGTVFWDMKGINKNVPWTYVEGGATPADKWNRAEIISKSGKLEFRINGVSKIVKGYQPILGHVALFSSEQALHFRNIEIKELPPEEPGWVQLFNGKDRTGWVSQMKNPKEVNPDRAWEVLDNILIARGTPEGVLRTEKAYHRYILEMECQASQPDPGWAGALLFHIPVSDPGGLGSTPGMMLRIEPGRQGSFAPQGGVTPFALRLVDWRTFKPDWNQLRFESTAGRFEIVLNGKSVLKFTEFAGGFPPGYFGIMSAGSTGMRYRNIRIKELPPEEPGWVQLFNATDCTE
jgi:uncharacterized protein (TIGR03067 family)